MQENRSGQLSHEPRGIIKWAPFNSLPEFTMQLMAKKNQKQTTNQVEIDREKDTFKK